MRDLYSRMRTNVDDVGVSRTDFLNGLTSYVQANGYQVSYESVKSGSTVNYEKCKNAIDNNKVVVLLAKPTSVYDINNGTSADSITSINISGAHIMVAFGYYEIKYYNNSGLFRTDKDLIVAMGQAGYTSKLFRSNCTDLEAAYIVNVQ